MKDAEMATWLPLIRFVQLLPQVLDRPLKKAAGLNHARYAILITLANQGTPPATMTELARIAGLSRSRLSHSLDSLEQRGWVTREICTDDRRTLTAAVTPAGMDLLRMAAPRHVEQVRELVLDPLDDEEREQLGAIMAKLLPGVTAAL